MTAQSLAYGSQEGSSTNAPSRSPRRGPGGGRPCARHQRAEEAGPTLTQAPADVRETSLRPAMAQDSPSRAGPMHPVWDPCFESHQLQNGPNPAILSIGVRAPPQTLVSRNQPRRLPCSRLKQDCLSPNKMYLPVLIS